MPKTRDFLWGGVIEVESPLKIRATRGYSILVTNDAMTVNSIYRGLCVSKRVKYLYLFIFAVTFLSFELVQEYIRPNYSGNNIAITYFLGVAPNFFPGLGLPALFFVIIPEFFRKILLYAHTAYFFLLQFRP